MLTSTDGYCENEPGVLIISLKFLKLPVSLDETTFGLNIRHISRHTDARSKEYVQSTQSVPSYGGTRR